MASLDPKFEWTLKVSTDELVMLLKALGGRLKPEELADAKTLGDNISKLRASSTKSIVLSNEKLMKNLGLDGGGDGESGDR